MAFESIAAYIDQIEEGFVKKDSPKIIAQKLGIPEKWRTIHRYKAAVWDLKDLVDESKEERAQHHDERREAAKVEIIKSLDLIEKIKWRASQHLDRDVGEVYETAEGERRATPGQVIAWHSAAAEMATKAMKLELEMSGDDPESRKASALESLSEAELDARLKELLAILDKAGSYPEGRGADQSPGPG